MTLADDLEAGARGAQDDPRRALQRRSPPEALKGDITPTDLHYVRSNFGAGPRRNLEIGGAVEHPKT